MGIGQTELISASSYSDSMPWNHKIVGKWLWLNKYEEPPKFIQPNFVDNEYPVHINTLIYIFWLNIGPATLFSIPHNSDMLPWNRKIVIEWI